MTKEFLSEDFLLDNDTACYLYHEHAEKMPIYDFHSHCLLLKLQRTDCMRI